MRAACRGERGSRERRRGWSCVGRECARVVVSALVCIVWQMSYEGGIWQLRAPADWGKRGYSRIPPRPPARRRFVGCRDSNVIDIYRISNINIDISNMNIVLLILLPSPTPDAGEQVSAGQDRER